MMLIQTCQPWNNFLSISGVVEWGGGIIFVVIFLDKARHTQTHLYLHNSSFDFYSFQI